VKHTNTLKKPHAHETEEHHRSAARKTGLADLPQIGLTVSAGEHASKPINVA
jgi:hypothetical protein